MTGPLTVVGMISGTSMDGIDVAAARLALRQDTVELEPLGATSVPYEPGLRRDLEAALPPAAASVAAVCRLDNEVGQAFAAAAQKAIADLAPNADLVVSHGQTLYHWVEEGRVHGSLQIGQPAWIAELTGLPVVADLRAADIAAGGQGAPLAGLFDALLLADAEGGRASVNIGGISNLTVVGPDVEAVAYDIGPGNALIDAAIAHVTGGGVSFDRDGEMGGRGKIHAALLDRLLAEPYYRQPPPKTTGKELFHLPYLLEMAAGVGEVADDDLVATVTALTAVTVADACRAYAAEEVIVAGGGADNPTLMGMLADRLPGVALRPIDELGIPAAAKESFFVALIGFLTVHGLAGNLPSATGASRPVPLGCLLPGRDGLFRAELAVVAPTRLRVVGAEMR